MNTKYSNSLLFATFGLDIIKNNTINLVQMITQTISFTRIDAVKLGENLEFLKIKRLLIVYIADYQTIPNITRFSNHSDGEFGMYTISFDDFWKDPTSKKLLIKNKFEYYLSDFNRNKNNIIFIFKDKSWTEIEEKFIENGYSFNIPKDYENFAGALTPINYRLNMFLSTINGLIGDSVYNIMDSFYNNPNHDNLKADPTDKGFNDLSTESILILDPIKSNTKYTDIEKEIDSLIN